jgi:hypothetical protein
MQLRMAILDMPRIYAMRDFLKDDPAPTHRISQVIPHQ